MTVGGARPGAGRKRTNASTEKGNKIVAARLRGGAEQGWEVLAEEYPSLIRKAVAMATGESSPDGKPSVPMLKALIELLPKIVGSDVENEDTIIAKLIGEIRFVQPESGSDDEPDLDRNRGEVGRDSNGGNTTRA